MAIFRGSNENVTTTTTNNSKATAIISQGVKIKGDLELTAKLHVEGVIEGNLNSTNEISIGREGEIKGQLKAKKLIVNGRFEGEADCDSIEVLKGGIVKGDIIIKHITIETGGCFAGTSTLKEDKITNNKNSNLQTTQK